MKGRVNCWRHRWGKWQTGQALVYRRGMTPVQMDVQQRTCARCGYVQSERV